MRREKKKGIFFVAAFAAVSIFFISSVYAFDATSTLNSFFIRQKIQSISGRASSTTFILFNAGGQTADAATSSSSSFWNWAGILKFLFKPVKPAYTQIHYHWRNDNGDEALATSGTGGVQDTATSSIPLNSVKRLRVEISNEGGTKFSYSAQQFRIDYGAKSTTCAAASYTDVGAVGGDWDMAASQLVEGNDTTNIAVATGGVTDENQTFLTPNGGQRETTSKTGDLSVSSNNFVELEYAIQAISPASGNYCFRVTNAGSADNFSYSVYPEAGVVAAAASLTFTIDTPNVFIGTNTPGTPAASSSVLTVNTNNSTGYNITVNRASTTPTLFLTGDTGTTIADTPNGNNWTAPATSSQAGPSAVWTVGTTKGFGFRLKLTGTVANMYSTAWWGTSDASGNAKYSGISTSTAAQVIANSVWAGSGSNENTVVEYKLDASNTQKTGNYISSPIIFTATTNP